MKILDNHKLLLNLLNCGDSLTIREIINACPTECCGAPKTSSSSSSSTSSSSSSSSSSSTSSSSTNPNAGLCTDLSACKGVVPGWDPESPFTLNVYKIGLNTESMAIHRFMSADQMNTEKQEQALSTEAARSFMLDSINGDMTSVSAQSKKK